MQVRPIVSLTLAALVLLTGCGVSPSSRAASSEAGSSSAPSSAVSSQNQLDWEEHRQIAAGKVEELALKPNECYWFERDGTYFCAGGTLNPVTAYDEIAQYYPAVQLPKTIKGEAFQNITFSAEDNLALRSSSSLPEGVQVGEVLPVELKQSSLTGVVVQYTGQYSVVAVRKGTESIFILNSKEEEEVAPGVKIRVDDIQHVMLSWEADGYSFFLFVEGDSRDEKIQLCRELFEEGIVQQFAMKAVQE